MDATKQVCPRFHRTVELIGKRWTGAILRSLLDGSSRFSNLLEAVPGLHDPVLSERLKELEREGIVARRVFDETPVRVEYVLTTKGRDLERIMREIQRWAERWVPSAGVLRVQALVSKARGRPHRARRIPFQSKG